MYRVVNVSGQMLVYSTKVEAGLLVILFLAVSSIAIQ